MTFRKTLGAIVLIGVIGLFGCEKKEEIDSLEKVGRIGDAYVMYGTVSWRKSHSLLDKDEKMVVKYDNGLTLRILDINNDGKIDRVKAIYDKRKAQELYDNLKKQLDEQ